MNKAAFVALGALALSSVSCGSSTKPPAAPEAAKSKADITRVLDEWHAAAAHADEAAYFAKFAPGAVFLGTDPTERWTLESFRSYAHPHFAKGKAWSFKATRREITVGPGGNVAWFDEDLSTENLGPARGTGVVVFGGTDEKWRIAQYSLSVPIPNDKMDAVKKLVASDLAILRHTPRASRDERAERAR